MILRYFLKVRIPIFPPKIPNASAFGIFPYYLFVPHDSLIRVFGDLWQVMRNSES